MSKKASKSPLVEIYEIHKELEGLYTVKYKYRYNGQVNDNEVKR